MSGPIDKISWLAEIFISLQGGRVLLVWSTDQWRPKAVCWLLELCFSTRSPSLVCQQGPASLYSYQPGRSLAGGSLPTFPHIPHTTLPAPSIIVWSGANFCSALRSSVAYWDPGPGLTQFYKIEPGGNSATQSWTKWIDTDFL